MALKGFPDWRCFTFVMQPRYYLLVPAALAALLVSCTSTPASSNPGNAASPTVATVGNGPEKSLQKWMTADAVRQIMGEPAEIKPMQTTVGKAEVWVYHRTGNSTIQQVQVGTRSTNVTSVGADGMAHLAQTVEEPVFAQQIEIVEETVSLLLFEGKLIEQKTTSQKRLEYK
jgi:hypothetical protein